MESILFNLENGIAHITLNRPDVYNSFNKEMALKLQEHLYECAIDDNIRCIVITGSGKAFCAGQDLQEAIDPEGPGISNIVAKHYNPLIMRIREMETPVVAAVNGVAAGAGANLALACDIVVATESATFIQAFSKIGLIPDSGGTYFLPRIVGFQKALALAMLGDKVGAKEAEQMGMIYKTIPDAEFDEAVQKLSLKLAQMPTKGLGLTKRLFNKSFNNDLQTQLALENGLQVEAAQTEDYKEGVNAFLEKRKPEFKGK